MANYTRNVEIMELLIAAGRTNDLIELIAIVAVKHRLSDLEIHFLVTAFKKELDARRVSLWILAQESLKSNSRQHSIQEIVEEYIAEVELEFKFYCLFVIRMLKENAKKFPPIGHRRVIHFKIVGDFNRYCAELDSQFHESTEAAKHAYATACLYARLDLQASHPTRLGVSLNYSLLYEDLQQMLPIKNEIDGFIYCSHCCSRSDLSLSSEFLYNTNRFISLN